MSTFCTGSKLSDRSKNKLTRLIEALKVEPNEKFDLHSWRSDDSEHPCKTTHCAVGLGIRERIFPNLKFCFMVGYWGNPTTYITNRRETVEEFEAVASDLGITSKEAEYLFSSIYYVQPTKHNVIRRLSAYVKDTKIFTRYAREGGIYATDYEYNGL